MHHSLYYSHLHSYLLPRTGRGTISTVLPVLHTLSSYREATPVHPSFESVPRPQTYLYVFRISCAPNSVRYTMDMRRILQGGRGCTYGRPFRMFDTPCVSAIPDREKEPSIPPLRVRYTL